MLRKSKRRWRSQRWNGDGEAKAAARQAAGKPMVAAAILDPAGQGADKDDIPAASALASTKCPSTDGRLRKEQRMAAAGGALTFAEGPIETKGLHELPD